jgi:hypothetical protein
VVSGLVLCGRRNSDCLATMVKCRTIIRSAALPRGRRRDSLSSACTTKVLRRSASPTTQHGGLSSGQLQGGRPWPSLVLLLSRFSLLRGVQVSFLDSNMQYNYLKCKSSVCQSTRCSSSPRNMRISRCHPTNACIKEVHVYMSMVST